MVVEKLSDKWLEAIAYRLNNSCEFHYRLNSSIPWGMFLLHSLQVEYQQPDVIPYKILINCFARLLNIDVFGECN